MINCSFSSFSPVWADTSNCHNSVIMNFLSIIFWNSYLLISTYNISKNEKKPMNLTNTPAWFLQTLASKYKKRNTFYWTTLRSKDGLLMKFGQFMSCSKINNFIKKFYKKCSLKTSSRSFFVCKELATNFIGKWNFWSNLLILDI